VIDIAPAAPHHLEALVALDSVAGHDPGRAAQIRAWVQAGTCHMLCVDGRAAAYGVLHHQFFNCGFIEMLMVGAGYRRQGLGRQLVEHLRSICARPKLFTSTNRSNTAMQAVLLQAGFQRSGQIDNLDEGDPEWVFFSPAGGVDPAACPVIPPIPAWLQGR